MSELKLTTSEVTLVRQALLYAKAKAFKENANPQVEKIEAILIKLDDLHTQIEYNKQRNHLTRR